MKAIIYFNYFFVGFPLVLGGIGLIDGKFLFYGLLFTILTGAFQLFTGIGLFLKNPNEILIQRYLLTVILYFIFLFFLDHSIFGALFEYVLFGIPTLLAFYFTIILHYKSTNKILKR